MRLIAGAGHVVLLCAAALAAQEPARTDTQRWIVTFRERSFDLSGLRKAIRSGQSAVAVARLVRDLDTRVARDQAAFTRFVESLGGRVFRRWWIINGCAVAVPRGSAARLRAFAGVARLDRDELAHPVTAPIRTSTNGANHNADAANAAGFRGRGVAVAIVDTGLDHSYKGSGKPHATFYIDGDKGNRKGRGIDGSRLLACHQLGLMSCDDVHDHGTGVASITAGERWNSTAQADRGHAPAAEIVGYAIADNRQGSANFSTIITAWNRVAADRAKYGIVAANNSYSGSPDPTHPTQQALDSCARNADVLIVAAAGNGGSSTRGSQSCANGLAVGACVPTTKAVASFSSRGPLHNDPGRFYPDLTACGVGIAMAKRDDDSTSWLARGTSMAAPQVCGAAALFRAGHKGSALMTKAALLATAEDVAAQNPGLGRNAFGLGFARSDHVVRARPTESTIASTSVPRRFPLPVRAGKTYRVAVAWFRTVLTSAAQSNLDLRVLDGAKELARSRTPANLYERVVFRAPRTGTLLIEVSAAKLDKSSVRFALCAFEEPPPRQPGAYVAYGRGCPGTGSGGQGPRCLSANDDPSHARVRSALQNYALLAKSGNSTLTVTGFDLYCSTVSGNTRSMSCWLYDRGGSGPGRVLRSGVMQVTGVGAWRTVRFDPVRIPAQTEFFLVFDNKVNLNLPIASPGTTSVAYYYGGPPAWRGPNHLFRWKYRVRCGPGGNNAVPVLGHVGVPEIGQSMRLWVGFARPRAALALVLGSSRSQWGALRLPLDLGPSGARGCRLLAAADVLVPAITDAGGVASQPFTVPYDTGLIGARFYNQGIVGDPGANRLGLAFTNGGCGTIGGSP